MEPNSFLWKVREISTTGPDTRARFCLGGLWLTPSQHSQGKERSAFLSVCVVNLKGRYRPNLPQATPAHDLPQILLMTQPRCPRQTRSCIARKR